MPTITVVSKKELVSIPAPRRRTSSAALRKLPPAEIIKRTSGLTKGAMPDGVEYQRSMRAEWGK